MTAPATCGRCEAPAWEPVADGYAGHVAYVRPDGWRLIEDRDGWRASRHGDRPEHLGTFPTLADAMAAVAGGAR